MIENEGYTIEQYPNHNRIIITAPQTWKTITSTLTTPVQRRVKLSENELSILLLAAKKMYEKEVADE